MPTSESLTRRIAQLHLHGVPACILDSLVGLPGRYTSACGLRAKKGQWLVASCRCSCRRPRTASPAMLSTARLPGPAPTGRQARLAGQRPRASSGAATATSASSDAVELIKKAAKGGFGQPSPAEVLQAVKTLERSNIPAGDDLLARLGGEQSPGFRWRLVYASGQKGKTPGSFFPIPACQRWDASKGVIENGVYLGGILGLIFQGPFNLEGRILRFDFNRLALRLGPWKPTFTIKQETNDFLEKLIVRRGMTEFTPAKRSLPLFKIIYVDDEVAVARGRSGGLAFWARTTPTWELENHVEGLD